MLRKFSDLREFQRDQLEFLRSRGVNAVEPLVEFRVGLRPVFLVADPGLAKRVLTAEESDIDKGRLIFKLREVIGRSSLTISGAEHRQRRAAIHKQLAAGFARSYVPEINATIRHTAASLARAGEVDAHRVTAPLALRIICNILFGRDALSAGDETALVEAVHLVEDDLAEEMFRALPHAPWAYMRKKRKLRRAREIMSLVVERASRAATELSLLRAFQDLGLEGEALRDEVLLMLLAGHHTTGTAAAWIFYHLGTDQTLADLLAEEATMLGRGSELGPAEVRAASKSRAFVQEVLRLYPSTYWMSRELKHDMELAGRKLKAGTSLIISPWHLHRDPRFWPEPDKLVLGRPLAASPAYMPFGYGPRACVGMLIALAELQLIALEFAASFRMEVVSQIPAAPPKPSVTLVPSEIRVRLSPRPAAAEQGVRAA